VSADISDELREKRREWGRHGGKRRLETMKPAERTARAWVAGQKGGAPPKIDREKVRELRAEGLKHREIAAAMGISMPSVARILKEKE
jgi:hypothetical protein